ncbi:MAG TPA: hypothetical protein VFH94_09745 [Streptomyces sp.]|nr:hypothetical protein [Streptomyces sp.]
MVEIIPSSPQFPADSFALTAGVPPCVVVMTRTLRSRAAHRQMRLYGLGRDKSTGLI